MTKTNPEVEAVRRMATRRGFKLRKSRENGRYALVDIRTGFAGLGGWSLDEARAQLRRRAQLRSNEPPCTSS